MKNYEVKTAEHLAVITLFDRSFTSFTQALEEITTKKNADKKVWMMQSVEKENEPLRVFIVFEF